jgi:pilus assembly protein CpaE
MRKTLLAFAEDEADKIILNEAFTALDGIFDATLLTHSFFSAVQVIKTQNLTADIIVVGMSESQDIFEDINQLAEVCLPDTKVIVYSNVNDLDLYYNLKEVGVHDYFHKPLNSKLLTNSLNLSDKNQSEKTAQVTNKAKNIAIIGVNGGVGASTLAIKLTHVMSQAHQKETLLLDLDPWFSPTSFLFDRGSSQAVYDIFSNIDKIDATYIKQVGEKISPKFNIISQNCTLTQTDFSFLEQTGELKTALTQHLDCCIFDVSRYLLVQYPDILQDMDDIILVAELNIASARNTIRILDFIKENTPNIKTHIIVNKLNSDAENISLAQFKNTTKAEVLGSIKYNSNNYKSELSIDSILKNKADNAVLLSFIDKIFKTKRIKVTKKWWKVG